LLEWGSVDLGGDFYDILITRRSHCSVACSNIVTIDSWQTCHWWTLVIGRFGWKFSYKQII